MTSTSLKKTNVDWLDGTKWRDSYLDMFVIVAALAFVVVSFLEHVKNPSENLFSRSGAVLVLFGAFMEYRQSKFERNAFEHSVLYSGGIAGYTVFGLPRHRSVIAFIAHLYILGGTVIWAYGDLLFLLF